jgi:hypothetical protein
VAEESYGADDDGGALVRSIACRGTDTVINERREGRARVGIRRSDGAARRTYRGGGGREGRRGAVGLSRRRALARRPPGRCSGAWAAAGERNAAAAGSDPSYYSTAASALLRLITSI